MTSDSHHRPSLNPFQAQAELELLQLLLNQRETPYVWDPAEASSFEYFDALEQEMAADGWQSEDWSPYVQSLTATVDQVWADRPAPTASAVPGASAPLWQRFTAQVPAAIVDRILAQVKQVSATNRSLSDQLVLCVQTVLTEWNEDDLIVLARPFAYAMRDGAGTEPVNGVLQSVRCTEWSQLSSIEQARLSLAIARVALAESTPDDA